MSKGFNPLMIIPTRNRTYGCTVLLSCTVQHCADITYAFPSAKSTVLWYAWSVILIHEVNFLTCLVWWVRLNVFISEWILYLFLPLAIKEDFIAKMIRVLFLFFPQKIHTFIPLTKESRKAKMGIKIEVIIY